jgi:hypothetical protein
LFAGIDEHNRVEQFSQIPFFSFDAALSSFVDPIFQHTHFPAKPSDPLSWILNLRPKLLPFFGQTSLHQFIDDFSNVSGHQSFSLQNSV